MHGSYVRALADLAWQGKPVNVRLRVRRFRCDDARCPRRTFTEALPAVAAPHARRTLRMSQRVVRFDVALGGQAGASLLPIVGVSLAGPDAVGNTGGVRDNPSNVPSPPSARPGLPRQSWYERGHALRRGGVSILAIAAAVGLARATVRKYLRATTCLTRSPRRTKVGSLTTFEAHLRARWEQGCRDAVVLWRELQQKGFRGSYRTMQ